MSSRSSSSSSSPSKKPTKPCPRCPHRLSDLASHVEPPETSETPEPTKLAEGVETASSNKVDASTAPSHTLGKDEVAEASAPPSKPTSTWSAYTPIAAPELLREDAFKAEDHEEDLDSENDFWSRYMELKKKVRFEIDLTPEEVAERAAAAEEAGKRASGGTRPKTILNTREEVAKVDAWPVLNKHQKVVRFKEVRFTAVRFVTDPEVYHFRDYDDQDDDYEEEEEGEEEEDDHYEVVRRFNAILFEKYGEKSNDEDREDSGEDEEDSNSGASTLIEEGGKGSESKDRTGSDKDDKNLAKATESLNLAPSNRDLS
ncbi:uncharacterized protein PAC_05867 [Phialocephala subalpina]|uniref:Uncharacterized protein n=1 Tax=Phialocephala subalpina TaxID=576137 RepID=A0A1L7WT85_9HELO|nr:uncharacterized protein PAC_05867 [Phialocephala subalpina]